jgi:hypothetical protein
MLPLAKPFRYPFVAAVKPIWIQSLACAPAPLIRLTNSDTLQTDVDCLAQYDFRFTTPDAGKQKRRTG